MRKRETKAELRRQLAALRAEAKSWCKSVDEALAAAEAIERGRLAREEASDVETPPLVILGQGEYARTIPAAHVDDEWLRDFARRTGRA